MQAIQVSRFGGLEQLGLAEIETPRPGRGEVLVKIAFAGVNFMDVYMRDGTYARSHTYQTPLPMTLGMEASGFVAAIGADVAGFAPGDRVAYCLSRGSYAEFAAVPASKLVKVPDAVPLDIAAGLMLQGCTAHYLSHSAFALDARHTCLVHAAAGGVGRLLVQLARARGARVLATAGSAEKAAIARRLGAAECILYREADFAVRVRELTGGAGVDVVYDSVGKATIRNSLKSLKRRGLCVNFGASSGQADPIAPLELAEAGSVFFTRPHLADYIASPEELRTRTSELFALYQAGRLEVAIGERYELAAAQEAHAALEQRLTTGKVLLGVARESGRGQLP